MKLKLSLLIARILLQVGIFSPLLCRDGENASVLVRGISFLVPPRFVPSTKTYIDGTAQTLISKLMQPLCIQLLFVKFSKIAQSCTLANLVNEIKCCSRITQAIVSLCLHHEYFCIAHEYPVVVALPGISGTPFIFIETSTCILGSIFEIVNFLV